MEVLCGSRGGYDSGFNVVSSSPQVQNKANNESFPKMQHKNGKLTHSCM